MFWRALVGRGDFFGWKNRGMLKNDFPTGKGRKDWYSESWKSLVKKRCRKGCYYVFDSLCYDYYVSTKKTPNSKRRILIVSYVNRSQIKPWSSIINRSPPHGCQWLIQPLGLVWHQHQLPRLSRGLSAKTCMAQFRGALEVIPKKTSWTVSTFRKGFKKTKTKRYWFIYVCLFCLGSKKISQCYPLIFPTTTTTKNESPSPNILHLARPLRAQKLFPSKVPLAGWLEDNYHIFREELAPRKISPPIWVVSFGLFVFLFKVEGVVGGEGWMKNMPLHKEKRCGVWLKCEGRWLWHDVWMDFRGRVSIFFERCLDKNNWTCRGCLFVFNLTELPPFVWNDVIFFFQP